MVGESESGDGRVVVLLVPAEKRFELDESGLPVLLVPAVQLGAAALGHQLCELEHRVSVGGHFRAGGREFVEGRAVLRTGWPAG